MVGGPQGFLLRRDNAASSDAAAIVDWMELVAFSLEGYRRFAEKTSVKLIGPLVAFVGPNEAGKSSLLRAIASLHEDEPFENADRPRRTKLEPTLEWHFKLDDDKEAIRDIEDTAKIERVIVTRRWKEEEGKWSAGSTGRSLT